MEQKTGLEDYTHGAVPDETGPRYGWFYLSNVEIAVTICVPVFMFGAWLGQSMTATNLLISLFISGVILSVISGWSSYIGVKTRLSTALLVKSAFGETSAKIVWLILAVSLFGWFGIQTEFFAKAFLTLMEKTYPDVHLDKTLVTIVSGLLMSSTAILGIKGVGKLAQICIPFLLLMMAYATYRSLSEKGIALWWDYVPQTPMSLGSAIAAIVGAYSIGAIVMPDVKRFARDKFHSIFAAILSLGIFYPLILFLTALTAVLMGQPDYMELLLGFGLGHLTLFMLMLATWTTNDMNLYSASLNLSPMFPKISRPLLTAISGVAGTVIATFGVFEHMMSFFMLLGVLTTPILALYSVDHITAKFQSRENNSGINLRAFGIWFLSSVTGVLTTPSDQMGFGLFTMTTVPGLDSLLVAVILSLLANRFRLFKPSR